jgi:RimJ/RimL family protein N-acetyltransferase
VVFLLGDGARVVVRPIMPGDKAALAAAFERLSEDSRHKRFLAYKGRLTGADLAYFTEVDHVEHEALVAMDAASGAIVGVARYVRLSSNRHTAEVAVTVVDEWQGRGVGTVLLGCLADRAREEGIRRFEAQALAENRRVIALLEKIGALTFKSRQAVSDVVVELAGNGDVRGDDRSAPLSALHPEPAFEGGNPVG